VRRTFVRVRRNPKMTRPAFGEKIASSSTKAGLNEVWT
jgi:hypothetical protein